MAIRLRTTFCVYLIILQIQATYEEIHRARTNSPKSAAKSASSYVAGLEKDQFAISSEKDPLLGTFKSTMNEVRWEVWCNSIFCAILVGLSGIFPLLVIPIEAGPTLKHGKAASRLKLLLSFAVGGLLGDVFLHLLPEAWAHIDKDGEHNHDGHTKVGLWVITGLLAFLIIEKMFAKEDEFEHLQDECDEAEEERQADLLQNSHRTDNLNNKPEDCIALRTRQKSKSKPNGVHKSAIDKSYKSSKNGSNKTRNGEGRTLSQRVTETEAENTQNNEGNSIKVSGYLNLAANVIDNFTHGLAVAAGFLVSNKVGIITTTAILLHEIPHEVGDFAILLRSGFDRWKAAKAQLLTATGGMVGALTALTADSAQAAGDSTAWILPFTSGGFLYIALVTVVPDLLEETHPRESTKQVLCLLAGISVMYIVSMVH